MALRNCTLFPDNAHLCTGTVEGGGHRQGPRLLITKEDVIVAVRKTMASLSLIGCLFIIAVIWLFKKYQIFTQRLILYLSIAALLESTSFLMSGFVPDGTLCEFQAFWLFLFVWAVLLWACCITFNLYQNAIRSVRTERFELIYHIVSWGISLLIASLPFIGDHYGPAGVWCWIDVDSSHSQIWRFTTWYIPLWVLLAAMLITYIYIVVKLRKEVSRWEGTYRAEDERQREMLKKDIKLLRAYPIVYMALAVFPSIHRIQNAFDDKSVFWLMLLHTICSPLQGAVNALVFAFDRETLQLLTWTSIKDALVQRTHFTTHPVREYTFAQTTGSSSLSASASDNSVPGTGNAARENQSNVHGDPSVVHENPCTVRENTPIVPEDPSSDHDNPSIHQQNPSINREDPSAENVRERNTFGNNDVV